MTKATASAKESAIMRRIYRLEVAVEALCMELRRALGDDYLTKMPQRLEDVMIEIQAEHAEELDPN